MEEKLKAIAEGYVDLLLQKVQNPDPYFYDINEGIRNLLHLDRMGLIRLPRHEGQSEHY